MRQAHVYPELASAHGFMRLRACWVYGEFAKSLFAPARGKPPPAAGEEGGFAPIFSAVLACMGDPELPVRLSPPLLILKYFVGECMRGPERPVRVVT